MTTKAYETSFIVGNLYSINGNMYVCSKLRPHYWEICFRSFPSMKGSSFKFTAGNTQVQLVATNVPFSRKSKKGKERVAKWLKSHPEYLI